MNAPAPLLTNIIASPDDDRDYPFDVAAISQFPARVDLRLAGQEIEDQLTIGSCTANATCSALEHIQLAKGTPADLSRLFLYYVERAAEGRLALEGAYLRDALKYAKNVGVPNEADYPYNVAIENVLPPQAIYDAASTQRLIRFERVPLTLPCIDSTALMQSNVDHIKSALAQGFPVVIGLQVYNWIFGIKGDMHNHARLDTSMSNYRDVAGGHAIVVVGYDDSLFGYGMGGFIIQNSWGEGWGDHGYGGLSYTTVADIMEAWVIRGFITPEVPTPAPLPLPYPDSQIMVAALYAALFGHAPDAGGFGYWCVTIGQRDAVHVANEMYGVDPARAYYPWFLTNVQIATRFYVNVLGRQPEMGGIGYWAGLLDSGQSPGQVIVAMINAVRGSQQNDAMTKFSQRLLENKIDVGIYTALTMGTNNLAITATALDGVTDSPASVIAAKERIRTAVLMSG